MKPTRLIFCLAMGTLSGVAGCSLAPTYTRPESSVPTTWPATAPATQPAALPGWQEFFTDPKLRQVIALTLDNNRDLRVAVLNARRARQLYGIRQADLLPVVDANAS